MNLANLLHQSARRNPTARAVTHGDQTWSYAEFSDRVARCAAYLRALPGMATGARIGIAMENSPAFLEVLYGCWHAGLCAVPMNAKLHAREFAFILENSGASACFASPALFPGIEHTVGRDRAVHVIETNAALSAKIAATVPVATAPGQPDDAAWLFYTSGTTGRPKGATLTLRNLLFMTLAYYADIDELDERDTILHPAPLSHGSGLYSLPHVARGAHQVVPSSGSFSAGEIFALIERWPNVSFFAAPTMLVRLLNDAAVSNAPLANLKTILYGGGPMYVADLERALEMFGPKLCQIYGQGESPMTITGLSKRDHARALCERDVAVLASAGSARTGVEVRILDDNDQELSWGEIGEIATCSDCVMQGYWQNSAANATTLRGGWLHTGDLGSMDARGFVTLKDRSKDMIISGGSNIYPREIEEVLLLHPRVAQASVVGASHPEWGEEVVAFIVPASGSSIVEAELDALCLQHIARYKRPRRYVLMEDLPKNNYGKVLKTVLRDQLKK